MLYLKYNTGAYLKLGPFVDDTDGKTVKTALTIANTDVKLMKDGGAAGNKNESSSATHDVNGIYTVTLNTTDTNTVGRLQISVKVAGALSVWAEFMVLPAKVFDSLVGGTDNLEVDTVQWLGTACTAPNTAGTPVVDVTRWLGTTVATPGTAGVPSVDMIRINNGLTSGNNATLSLKQLNVNNNAGDAIVATSSGSNGHGINATGNGSGNGILATGGNSATTAGLKCVGGAATANGIFAIGNTSGDGLHCEAGSTGEGIHGNSTLSSGMKLSTANGDGLIATGGSAGNGINATGAGAGNGILATGGNSLTTGGIKAVGGAATANGIFAFGNTTGSGLRATGGASGDGITATGGATSGGGLNCQSTNGNAIEGTSTNNSGMLLRAGGVNAGLFCWGGASAGPGAQFNGGTGGDGLYAIGVTTGSGIRASGGASGAGAKFIGLGSNSYGMYIEGAGAGSGLHCLGGNNGGSGITAITQGAGATPGIAAYGVNGGAGMKLSGGATGAGLECTATAGNGILASGAGGYAGIKALGNGAGAGLECQGGATGNGLFAQGGASGGNGLAAYGVGGSGYGAHIYSSVSLGLLCTTGATDFDGARFSGNGVGSGLNAIGGANGNGARFTGQGTGNGFQCIKGASGKDIDADEIDGIKTKTDQLNFTGTDVKATLDGETVAVGSIAANAITAASIATDAIDSDALAASAITEIQNGLATPTNITAGTITTVTNLTNAPTSGDLTTAMKASVNAEVDTALADINLDHLMKVAAVAGDVTNSSIIARMTSKSATPAFSSFNNTTDSLEAIADEGGAALTSQEVRDAMKLAPSVGAPAAGSIDDQLSVIDGNVDDVETLATAIKAKTDNLPASPASEGNVDAVEAKVDAVKAVTDKINFNGADDVLCSLDGEAVIISGTKQTLDALQDISTAQVNAEVDTALADINLNHLLKDAAVAGDVANSSVIARLASKSATPSFASYDNTTDALEAIADGMAGGLTQQDVADAMLLAPVGVVVEGSVSDRFDDLGASVSELNGDLAVVDGTVTAIKSTTDNLPDGGTLIAISAGVEQTVLKLPTNFIMGSSTQDDIDTDIATILSKLPHSGTIFGLDDMIDDVPASELLANLLAMANGRFVVDEPVPGKVTFYRQDNATAAFVCALTETERTRD